MECVSKTYRNGFKVAFQKLYFMFINRIIFIFKNISVKVETNVEVLPVGWLDGVRLLDPLQFRVLTGLDPNKFGEHL